MTSLNEKYADVAYNARLQAVEVKWKGFANLDQYKQALIVAMKIIIETKCERWISDMVHGEAVPQGASEWLKNEFIPMAVKKGVKKAGFLFEANVFRKMFSDSVKSAIVSTGAELKYFDSKEEMEKWIVL